MMKNRLTIAACLVLILADARSEGFNSIHSPNGVDVWAVGNSGTVFHSLDGGATLQMLSLGTADLNSVFTLGTNIWIVGNSGSFFFSSDNGNNWSSQTVGDRNLQDVLFLNTAEGWCVGDSGLALKTIDRGITWSTITSGTESINSISMPDSMTIYLAGDGGMVMKSQDGGNSWLGVSDASWKEDITSIAAIGQTLFVVGTNGFCAKSTNGGTVWKIADFQTDSKSDVRDVFMQDADNAYFVGGGGYIRKTPNGGASFNWQIHPLHGTTSSVFFYDPLLGWTCSDKNNVILRTSDGGNSWVMPTGTSVSSSWNQKLNASSSIGNTFVINPLNKDHLYVALGRFIYMSVDRGETWEETATISSSFGSTHSFFISPYDTNTYVVAFTGGGDHIRRSTDRGVTWTTTISRDFSSFGMPLEMDGSHADTLVFAPEDGHFYRSDDFGSTWQDISQPNFSSPCDVVVVRDSASIIWVGDSGPGRISRSTDGGVTWTLIQNVGSAEIPTIGHGDQDNSRGFATAWSSGGLLRTTDYGATWTTVSGAGSTWGVDVSKDDPNVVMFGVYGGSQSYLSTNGGNSFATTTLSGSNYAILCYDRATFFAQQGGGVWKYNVTYTVPTTNAEALVVLEPNGGEQWGQGEDHEIRWTSSNIGNVKIEYRVAESSPWELIAASVPAGTGLYTWMVPNQPTNEARVRVGDASDQSPVDSSNGVFSITTVSIAVTPESLAFGGVRVGEGRMDTLRITNGGTGTLVVSSVVSGSGVFIPGRTSFTIGAGETDTLSVWFVPGAVQEYRDTLVLTTNAPGGEYAVLVTGTGETPLGVEEEEGIPTRYVLEQNYPNPFNPETEIRYGVTREGQVKLAVFTMLGEEVLTLVDGVQEAGWYRVVFGGKGTSGGNLSSGLYLYRLSVKPTGSEGGEEFVSTKKMLLLK